MHQTITFETTRVLSNYCNVQQVFYPQSNIDHAFANDIKFIFTIHRLSLGYCQILERGLVH